MLVQEWIVDALVKTTGLLIFISILDLALRRSSAAVRHLGWRLGNFNGLDEV